MDRLKCPNCNEYALEDITNPDENDSFWVCLDCDMDEITWEELTV
jgi:hypothetical protein